MKLLNLDDKKAVKKRLAIKPKRKPLPVSYTHTFKKEVPMDIKKQMYNLYQQNELTAQQISERFGLPPSTTRYIIRNYPRQTGIAKEIPRHDERILTLELRVNRLERELNI